MDELTRLRAELVAARAEVEALSTLYSTEHHAPDPRRAVLFWLEIPDSKTGTNELVCAGLMTARIFSGIKYFSYLPQLRGLPCPIALPRKTEPPSKPACPTPKSPARAPLSQRRRPGFNLDGSPRKKRSGRL